VAPTRRAGRHQCRRGRLKASADFEAKPSYSFNVIASGSTTTTTEAVTNRSHQQTTPQIFTSGATGAVAKTRLTSTAIYTTDADNLGATHHRKIKHRAGIAGHHQCRRGRPSAYPPTE
jgi:hypothetical protein